MLTLITSFSNHQLQFGISGLVETWITLGELYFVISLFFSPHFKTSSELFQLFKKSYCFPAKLQKCFEDETHLNPFSLSMRVKKIMTEFSFLFELFL